jgi:hypothetical protein
MSDVQTLATAATTPAAAPPAAPAAPAATSAPAPSTQRLTPGTPEWAAAPTEARHAAIRGPENPRARGYSPAVEQREKAAQAAPAPSDQQPAADPSAPTHGTEKYKIGAYEVSEADVAEMMSRQAIEDQRKLTLPAAPESYEAKLPDGLKLPGNVEYKFDNNDPSLIAARNLAHARGWSQQDFSDALAIFATHTAREQAMIAERSAAEVAKAGVNAPQRVDAVRKFITAEMGEADARQINALIVTDSMLRYHERMITKLTSQGTASFSQSHRTAPDTNGIPGYDNMSFEQRRYAQDQAAARRR